MNNFPGFKTFFSFKTIIICFIILLLLSIRYYQYDTYPRHGATFDEFAWTWLGINLIQKHEPISWSSQPQYANRQHLIYQGAAFWIVKPYLEHPPLFGIVAGTSALLFGAKDMYHVNLHIMRRLSLILSFFSLIAIFLLAKELYNFKTGLLSLIIYGTTPTIVIGSRIVQNENFLIPLWLLALLCIVKYLKTYKNRYKVISFTLAAVLILAKIPWVVVAVSLGMILLYHQKWKDIFFLVIITLFSFSIFLMYGAFFDKELFYALWRLQLARYDIHFTGIYSIVLKPLLVDRFFLDGWIYMGIISIFILLKDYKKHIYIIFPFLAYFLIYIFGIPDEPSHGWYRYPFYPFLLIALSIVLYEYYAKNFIYTFLTIILIAVTLFDQSWVQAFGFSYFFYRLVIILSAVTLLPIFFSSYKLKKIVRVWSYAWFVILIMLNVWVIMGYVE